MSVQPRKVQGGGTVYDVVFLWQGKQQWEKAGTSKREAQQLEKLRRKEVRDGTYVPPKLRRATTFGQECRQWCDSRRSRNAAAEVSAIERYVLTRPWLTSMSLLDVKPSTMLRLVAELRDQPADTHGRPLGTGTVRSIFMMVRACMADAVLKEHIVSNPCVLPKGTFRHMAAVKETYTIDEIRTLVTDPRIPEPQRVWAALAFYTGMRKGEVCGRTWKDWNRTLRPLGGLDVRSQYDNQLLKTEKVRGEHPRGVPVHPDLARILTAWWDTGFACTYLRRPELTDPIVPTYSGGHRGPTTCFDSWQRACRLVGIRSKTIHSTRHTFITLCIRGGANEETLETVTHNAKGSIMKLYTHREWAAKCVAVDKFGLDESLDAVSATPSFSVFDFSSRDRSHGEQARTDANQRGTTPGETAGKSLRTGDAGAKRGANQPPPPFLTPDGLAFDLADAFASALEKAGES